MPPNALWSRDELLVAFRLYCHERFGRLHTGNPRVRQIARLIGRTPSAVVYKACNFASLDPFHRERGVSGFGNVSQADRKLWEEFTAHSEAVAAEAEHAWERLSAAAGHHDSIDESRRRLATERESEAIQNPSVVVPDGPTELEQTIRARRVQRFFRRTVLASYERRCALSGLAIPELIIASHIIPWRANVKRRADPRNGIALHALFDRAFDRGLIAFDEQLHVLISRRLSEELRAECPTRSAAAAALFSIEGRQLNLPDRFRPDPTALSWHRATVFLGL